MAHRLDWLVGAGVGAGLMYVLDPRQGRRRRSLARDKIVHLLARSDDALAATARDFTNRARGLMAEAATLFRTPEPVSDHVLAERVRAELGFCVSHPSSIEVTATEGRAILSGPVLASELSGLLAAVRRVRGVREVVNRLEIHQEPGDVPGLQGGAGRSGRRYELMQSNWSPAARVLVGGAGIALVGSALRRPGRLRGLLGIAGLGLLARAATNQEVKRLAGVDDGRRALDVHEAIEIDAPVDRVFELWRRYENFPRFMPLVRSVRELGGGRSHWTVAGLAGVPVEWDAEVTQLVPNEVLAWKTLPGSRVEHAGIVRFQRTGEDRTTVNIRISYNPPAGALGHAVAMLFGADPESGLRASLLRMKSLIERGEPPRNAEARDLSGGPGYVH